MYLKNTMLDSMWSLWVEEICAGFVIICIYLLPLEIQLSRRVGILLTSLTLATFLCLSQARTWISNVICSRLSLCSMIWCPIQFADHCQCWQILEPSFVARDIKVIINTWQQQYIFIWGVIGRFHLIVKLSAICCYVNFGFAIDRGSTVLVFFKLHIRSLFFYL